MNHILLALILLGFIGWANAVPAMVTSEMAQEKGCLSCHEGIEAFTEGRMWDDILEQGASHNDENGCVICHGGNPLGITIEQAHKGSPASLVEKGGPKLFSPILERLV
jgi:cytochrome c551/c552